MVILIIVILIGQKMADALDECVRLCQLPEWIVEGRTILIMKDKVSEIIGQSHV